MWKSVVGPVPCSLLGARDLALGWDSGVLCKLLQCLHLVSVSGAFDPGPGNRPQVTTEDEQRDKCYWGARLARSAQPASDVVVPPGPCGEVLVLCRAAALFPNRRKLHLPLPASSLSCARSPQAASSADSRGPGATQSGHFS